MLVFGCFRGIYIYIVLFEQVAFSIILEKHMNPTSASCVVPFGNGYEWHSKGGVSSLERFFNWEMLLRTDTSCLLNAYLGGGFNPSRKISLQRIEMACIIEQAFQFVQKSCAGELFRMFCMFIILESISQMYRLNILDFHKNHLQQKHWPPQLTTTKKHTNKTLSTIPSTI